ncbi:FecR family protein [Paraburkholderia acidisoli]|uniref:LysM peptidoglycan-binding domain-containing protein n=1 Tax=Paraburkholderia acidisoli TaxID=2571748 RepID=A0A7Z2GMD8_9BURK|nr:FecR domain-containing protein [Paraburkholderia acidisoli]QGZ64195.1 LysM peptidoglycan-binding domain-containing protein [Paraburkholderia acidisoli]
MSAARRTRAAAKGRAACASAAPLVACAFALVSGARAVEAREAAPRTTGRVTETTPYETRAGDSLYSIAARYLQNPADWKTLARVNRVSAPRRLQPGTVLRVPVALLRQDPLSATVIAANGPAQHAFRNGPLLPLRVGAKLVEGDRVQTGTNGFATLELADGSHLVLPADTSLNLATLRQTVLTGATDRVVDLHRGEVNTEVTHATKKDDRFQIRSPSVVAGVRGTQFRVTYDGTHAAGAATTVEVLDGAVGVDTTSLAQGWRGAYAAAPAPGQPLAASEQLVLARYGSVTVAGEAAGSPVALLEAPALQNASKIQDDADVAFDLAPPSGARGYRVQIGRDAGLLDLVRDVRSNAPHVSIGALDDGTYFVRISAIDARGLEGIPAAYAFERRRLALGASAGPIEGSRDFAFRWFVEQGAQDTHFRFVLAATPDLRVPLVDHPDIAAGEAVVRDLPKGVYYWTVIAEQFDHGRYYQKASPIQSFRLDW